MVRAAAIALNLRGFDAAVPSTATSLASGFCYNSATAFALSASLRSRDKEPEVFPARQFAGFRCGGILAGRGAWLGAPAARAGAKLGRLRRCGRYCGAAFTDRAVEGRAVARAFRRGEAARRRIIADRARRQRRRHLAHAAWRAALFLDRRGEIAGGGHLARQARRRTVAPRSRATSPCAPTSRRIRTQAAGSVWPLHNTWNRATENLYSAWIEKLFDAPLDVELSWPALHVGLRDCRAISCSTIWVSAKTR